MRLAGRCDREGLLRPSWAAIRSCCGVGAPRFNAEGPVKAAMALGAGLYSRAVVVAPLCPSLLWHGRRILLLARSAGGANTVRSPARCRRNAPIVGRLLLVGQWPPITGRLRLAAYCQPLTSGRLLLAAHAWPPTSGRLLLAAYHWLPTTGRLLAAGHWRQRSTGRQLLTAWGGLGTRPGQNMRCRAGRPVAAVAPPSPSRSSRVMPEGGAHGSWP